MADTELQRMVERLSDKEVFLVADESEVNGNKFFSVPVGDVSQPEKIYLVHGRPVQTMDKQINIHVIDEAVRALNVNRNNFVLLLSDAVLYMVAAGTIL